MHNIEYACITPDKGRYPNNLLFLKENICCEHSLEVPPQELTSDNVCFPGEIRKTAIVFS